MQGSWRIARVAGIDLSIHWTFGLLLGWVLMSAVGGLGWGHGLLELLFVLTLFGCVVLHELGHALAARMYGIPTHSITLLPIGGLAQLERIPRDPRQESVIALAGPAVNVLIVGLLFPLVTLLVGAGAWASPLLASGHWLARLMWVNVMLVCFNLLPAFPMDGGRILRSVLARRTDYMTATRWAKRLGQTVAIGFLLLGLWKNPLLLLIAGFVFYAAEAEYRSVQQEQEARRWMPWKPATWPPDLTDSAIYAWAPESLPVGGAPLGPPNPSNRRRSAALHQILPSGVVIIHAGPLRARG
jgi:Zn-dependent protease